MNTYANILQTPLEQLPFSPACLQWFRDAGVHTVEDAEEDITLLARSKYYKQELVDEMVRVIKQYMLTAKQNDDHKTQFAECVKQLKQQTNITSAFLDRFRKR